MEVDHKIIQTESKDHFINKYVCISKEGEIFLMLILYYSKKADQAHIDRIEIKEKHHFLNKEQLLQRKQSDKSRVVPPSNNNK